MSLKIGPYLVTKGALLPYEERGETDQDVDITSDGGVVVHERPFDTEYIRAVIKCQLDEARVISGYLRNGVRYRAIPFTIVDGFGTSRLVRFWDRRVRSRHLGANRVELDLLFRQEVTP